MAKTLISKEHEELIAQLEQDVQHAFQNAAGNDPFWSRTLVRAVFSYFEAHGFVIRLAAAKLLKPVQGNAEFLAKMALLAETTFQPGKTGRLEYAGEPKSPFINQLSFTLRTYAEVSGMAVSEIDGFFGDNAFNQLQRAKRVRDRLTHPKQLSDVLVAPRDIVDTTTCYNWLRRFISVVENLQ